VFSRYSGLFLVAWRSVVGGALAGGLPSAVDLLAGTSPARCLSLGVEPAFSVLGADDDPLACQRLADRPAADGRLDLRAVGQPLLLPVGFGGLYRQSGVDIPSVTGGLGQATFGPNVSCSFTLGDGTDVRASVAFDGGLEVATDDDSGATTDLHGRVDAGLNFAIDGGAAPGVAGTYDGIGSPDRSTSGRMNASVPIN
jgi:hypothetical protein